MSFTFLVFQVARKFKHSSNTYVKYRDRNILKAKGEKRDDLSCFTYFSIRARIRVVGRCDRRKSTPIA